jgi:outer membrane protein assembly factor BamB
MPISALTAASVAAASSTDWPMYLHDGSLSAASSETILAPAAAPSLRPLWMYKTGGVISASATVVGGVAYVGSWDGYEYALNATTGALVWKTYLGITTAPSCSPPSLGVSSVAAVTGGVVYVGGGDSNWYALDASTGSVLWNVPTGDNSATGGHYNWSSPLIVGNSAYIGIASLGDCPLVQGQLLRVDLTTHAVVASVNFVPTGQVGGGVWTSPSIDTSTNTVYVTTGTLNNPVQTTSEAMVAVDATTLAIKSYWQIPRSAANADSDWGNSPILFSDGNGRSMVAGVNKNGFLYAFDRSNLALGPVWSDQIAVGGICPTCGDASVASMAFAQGLLYVGGGNTTIAGVGYPGAVRAINPTTGAVVWERGLASPVIPALAYDNGMVLAGSGPRLEILDAGSGNRLFSYATGATIYSPPSISNGVVYVGSGDGNIYAFAPTTPGAPPADPNCPSGLVCQDIGAPAPAGSETVSAGSWSISASGAGIGGTTDQLRLMSQAWSGSVQAQARIVAQSVVGTGTESGLMARQAGDPGSPFYSVAVAGGNSVAVQYRTSFGGAAKTVKVTSAAPPTYLEIVRNGDSFSAASSPDGATYTLIPGSTATDVMPDQLMVGLFATSGSNGTASASTIGTVSVGAPGTAPSPPASPSPCPAGWSCSDVGNPPAVGDQSLASSTWTISGAGTASGANAYGDQFHLVWQPIAGDATLSARVATQANTSAGAQAGLVFRADSSTPGADSYGAFVTPTNGMEVVYRPTSGLRTVIAATASGSAPAYLEITRYGNTYTTFTSPDGVTWSAIIGSSVTFGAAGTMVAGMVVNSGAGSAATDTFDSVSLAGSAAPPPSLCSTGWTCQDIGSPTPGVGSQYTVGSNLTVQAGGDDIWGVYDSFRLLSQPLAADGTISVRVDSQSNTSTWAKAGVMIRATNDPASPYFGAFITPGNGVAVQYRTTQGGNSSQLLVAGTAPAWLQVSRSGGTFTAYTSTDGVTWTAIPGASVGITMTGTLLAGLAVTAHNGGQQGTVTFDTATLTNVSATPPGACPTSWSCADVGNVGIAGGQSLTSGTWTVQGGGGDIWDVADNFHYIYQSLATDGSASARVVAQTNTSAWAKAGVMLRSTTDPGSPYYAAFVTPSNGIAVQWRSTQAGTSSQVLTTGSPPEYIKVARSGGSYAAYTSPDGSAWTLVPNSTVNLGLTGTVLAGLAITSHDWAVLGSATFDTVTLATLPPPWLDTDIGAPAVSGSATSTGGVFTVRSGGTDIFGTTDQLNLVSQPVIGDTTLSARVASQTNTSSWAKAGVMLRATTDPGSPYYAAFATPGNGIVVQWRKTQAATTSQITITGTVPAYLEVARSGNAFTAYTSANGSTWTPVPGSSVTFAMPGTVVAGLAATSHSGTAMGTATFDSVSLGGSAPPPPNDFSIAATPPTVSVVAGHAGTTSIGTTLVSGSAETIALAATGLPTGVTAGFGSGSVSTGGSTTLTLTVGSSVAAGSYPITLTGTAPSATHSTTATLTVTSGSATLPSPWTDTDVGSPSIAGSVSFASGVFTLKGSGADIFGTSDQFNYVYQPSAGNGTMIARVTSMSNTSSNAKAGIIWKASTTAGSPYILIAAAPSGLVKVQYNFNGSVTTSTYTYPNLWMKLVRSGNSFSAYLSPDGVTWKAVLSNKSLTTIPTAATVGIFECSHSTTKLGTATFDHVSYIPGP